MNVKVVLVTTLLFVNFIVVSMVNVNSTGNIKSTTDVNGNAESHTATTEVLTVADNDVQATSPTDKPIVSEANIQSMSTTETLAVADDSTHINTTTESHTVTEATASEKPTVAESYIQSTTTTQRTDITDSDTQGIYTADKSNIKDEATTVIIESTSSTSFDDVTRQQQKSNDVTESVTTIYKIETKTKSVAEVEPNMDRFIDPPTPLATNTDIAAAVKVEEKEIKEIKPTDAKTTDIPDTNASADSTTSTVDETTTFSLQDDIPLFLKELVKQHLSEDKATSANTEETTSGDGLADQNVNSEKKPIVEWWESIKPNRTDLKTATVTVKNADIDTRIITTDKLVIVISTICGSFVLFVVILIVVSCCRRNNNGRRTDSEKSGTSEFSVVSTRSNGLYEKQSSTKSRSDSIKTNDYNDVFMGIPTNNAIWKDLDNLPDTTSNVMPESTKL